MFFTAHRSTVTGIACRSASAWAVTPMMRMRGTTYRVAVVVIVTLAQWLSESRQLIRGENEWEP